MSALEYAHSDAFAKSRAEFGSFEIEPKELEFFDVIGSGSFGDVYRGKVRGKECAIKKLKGQVRLRCSLPMARGPSPAGRLRVCIGALAAACSLAHAPACRR